MGGGGGRRESRSPERKRDHKDSRHKHKSKSKSSRDDRDRDRDKDRDHDRRDRDKDRSRDKDHERDRGGRDRDRDKDRDKRKERDDDDREKDRKRARQEGDGSGGAKAPTKEEKMKAEEATKLDAEMEKRRKRVAEWQALRRKQQEEQDAADAKAAEEAAKAPKWDLEGESDDEGADLAAGANGKGAEGDEVDPLDAFMAANSLAKGDDDEGGILVRGGSAAAPAPAEAAASKPAAMEEDDEEEDPLDAFMNNQVLPEVGQKLDDAKASEQAYIEAQAREKEDSWARELQEAKDKEVEATQAAWAAAAAKAAKIAAKAGGGAAAGAGGVAVKQEPVEEEAGAAVKEEEGGGAPPGPGGGGLILKPGGSGAIKPGGFKFVLKSKTPGAAPAAKRKPRKKSRYDSESSSDEEGGADSDDDQEWSKNVRAGKGSKVEKILNVDHSLIEYPPFRKDFYIAAAEIQRMSPEDIAARRKALDNIKVRGKDVPAPISGWTQCGLSQRILEVIRKNGYESPMPIQAQALPVIMSGRDCIGIAKTGSGKTMAFLIPMLRHIKDQPPLAMGDGPICLVMAPTRELVQQIGKDAKAFARQLALRICTVFGGSGVADQIGALKRGAEIVVCTPGRMIDILATGAGKITNFRRVTYLVMDEADRMFDMGFEPQISRMVGLCRPDRQTVMFSATFPRQVESLARAALDKPVEIQVGGRSIVNADITQIIEVRTDEEDERLYRLLELLGEWYELGKVLVFTQSQDRCDSVFRNLLKAGYPCLSLHGGKEQTDRECTIADFKGNVCNIMIATSVAARGLDVKDLVLVVNYDCPNHHEDYVHRCGRTGRAGNKGTAVTFIHPDEEQFAPDLVKALRESGAPVPEDLNEMAEDFKAKLKSGMVQAHGSGFGGSGFKFNEAEEEEQRKLKKAAVREIMGDEAGEEEKERESDSDDDGGVMTSAEAAKAREAKEAAEAAARQAKQQQGAGGGAGGAPPGSAAAAMQGFAAAAAKAAGVVGGGMVHGMVPPAAPPPVVTAAMAAANPLLAAAQKVAASIAAANQGVQASMQAAGGMMGQGVPGVPPGVPQGGQLTPAAAAAAAFAAKLNTPGVSALPAGLPPGVILPPGVTLPGVAGGLGPGGKEHYEAELEINDFPQHARWKATHKESLSQISEWTGAAITTRGNFVPKGKEAGPNERKLYLLIEGPTESGVKKAKSEIKSLLQAATEKVLLSGRGEGGGGGRYNV